MHKEAAMGDSDVTGAASRPWFVVPLLVLSVLAISSAGAVTKLMEHGAAVSKAAWRLQATSAILLPGFLWDWWWLPPSERCRTLQLKTLGILAASALALALHFGLWVWSLDHTSLPHSLLLVSMPPVILAVISWLRCQPLSIGETIGIALGTFGVLIIAAAARVENNTEVTLLGDLAALLAAAAFVVYMIAGRNLRAWMPLYVYVFPVTAGAAILLSIACIFLDGQTTSRYISGPFAWLSKEFWLPNVYLAIGPGFVGHTGLNAILRYCDTLVVSMAVTLEPIFGSVIGWLLNVSPAPGVSTCIGGAILVLGTIWVNYASGKAELKSMQSMDASHCREEEDLAFTLMKDRDAEVGGNS